MTNTARRNIKGDPMPSPARMTVVDTPADLPDGIEWADPGPSGHRRPPILTQEIRAALRSQPGRWAKVRTYHNRTTANAVARQLIQRGLDGFEATGRATPEGGSALYVRAVPTDPS